MLSAHDIALVQRKLVQTIGTAVDGLNNLDKIERARSAALPLWRYVGALWDRRGGVALDARARPWGRFHARCAWVNVYGVLGATMQAGAAEIVDCAPRSSLVLDLMFL